MKWVYDLCGAEPIIKDMPIYDAATIVEGELVMRGAASYTAGTNAGFAFISCGSATATSNTVANGLGICLETKTTASSPTSIAAVANTLGGAICYGKCIINPFAIYRAAIETGSTALGGALVVAAGVSNSTVAAITVTGAFSTTAAGIGNWLIFTGTAGPNYGTIRRVQASGASVGSADIDVAFVTAPTTADRVVLVELPCGGASIGPHPLNVAGTKVGGGTLDEANVQAGLRVVDNYIDRGLGVERLTTLVHANGSAASGRVNAMSATVPLKIYSDLFIKDHMFGGDL